MDSIDYYNRYAVPYYEETVDASMEEVMKPFVELLSEESENAEVFDLGYNLFSHVLVVVVKGQRILDREATSDIQ